jgi:MYXO-CTERM domain-containing protein
MTSFLGLLGFTVCLTAAMPASAGVPECGNIRFEGLSNCEVRATADCDLGCKEFGVYDTACATKLVTVCDQQCTTTVTTDCTNPCEKQCKGDCDNGINVICQNNCFAECTTDRDAQCALNADNAQCQATWNANCDSKCHSTCVTVDASCYQHCLECCDGSCRAIVNMDCQTSCQDVQFEQCEQEFRADCEASCSGDGALFCDGTYIISGSQIPTCIQALAAQGIEVKAGASVTIGPDGVDSAFKGGICSYGPGRTAPYAAPFAAFAAAAAWLVRRRKHSAR